MQMTVFQPIPTIKDHNKKRPLPIDASTSAPANFSKKKTTNSYRELTPLEVSNSLADARIRGLPDGWKVIYDNKQLRKLWISPHGGKACKSIPEALAMAGVKPFLKKALTSQEKIRSLKKAKDKGLPDGWDVSWDPQRRRSIWISPDKLRNCDSIPEALELAGIKPALKRELSNREIEDALTKAKARGLPDGWTVSWDNKARRRRWISPNGKIAKGIPEAVAMASQREMTPEDVARTLEQKKQPTTSGLVMLADVGRLLTGANVERTLTKYEKDQALAKAKARGLPDGWSVKCNKVGNKKIWISPKGKICNSIPEALAAAGVTPPKKRENARSLSTEEVEAAMEKAKKAGLPEGWRIDPVTRKRQKIFISPRGQMCKGLTKALALSGVVQTDNSKLTKTDVESYLKEADDRGLKMGNGWTVFFDSKCRQKRWISPEGEICDALPNHVRSNVADKQHYSIEI